MQVENFIVRNQFMIKTGQPIEIELTDGTIHSGDFFQRWQKKSDVSQIVLIKKVGTDREKVHYYDETVIKDIKILGPYGKPLLFRIK